MSWRKEVKTFKGDMTKVPSETLKVFRAERANFDGEFEPNADMKPRAVANARIRWTERQEAQHCMREVIAWWAGVEHASGYSDSETYRRFYDQFGIDVASAQLLGPREAVELAERVNRELEKFVEDRDRSVIPKPVS
jgi:hypothetical protein